jgi:hypothetical protein
VGLKSQRLFVEGPPEPSLRPGPGVGQAEGPVHRLAAKRRTNGGGQ